MAISLSPRPEVCVRREIILADASIAGSKQPFHAAEPLPLPKARMFLQRCTQRTNELAMAELGTLVSDVQKKGGKVIACGLLASSGRVPDSIEAILSSHAAIHSAEGELYRQAIVQACEHCRLPLLKIREKEALVFAQSALRLSADQITRQLMAMGRALGPPWTQDQKLAALAAWVSLAATSAAKAARQTA